MWAVDKSHYEIARMLVSRDDLNKSTKNVEEVTNLVLGSGRASNRNTFLEAVVKSVENHQIEFGLFILCSVQFGSCKMLDSAFLYSAQECFYEIVKQLVKSSIVDINVVDEKKNTALIL